MDNINNKHHKRKINMHKQREELIFTLYRYFILNQTKAITIQYLIDYYIDIDDDKINKFEYLINNIEQFIMIVQTNLIDWSFSRLNNLEKSILVYSAFEITYLKTNKKIVINEAIIISKAYNCNNNYINAVLDKII